MKLSVMIKELQRYFFFFGDVEVYIQSNPSDEGKGIVGHESFFIVPERYRDEDGGQIINIRSWPY